MTWFRSQLAREDRGSTVPLILGFFLIAFVFCTAAVMASDAFARQRNLQSICDGAAVSAANAADLAAVRGHLSDLQSLPLAGAQDAVDDYLARDDASSVTAQAAVSGDGAEVTVTCSRPLKLAFAAVFGRNEIMQRTSASARSPLQDQ